MGEVMREASVDRMNEKDERRVLEGKKIGI